ncbi:hypothetical protein ABEG63_13790, partial [Chryseobacterium sp. C39-AII1]|uniref:hypothetical protein n=1 Tax=Chryseobacterium sp. C39-AII1 TaxID=3080332 RepID=UPI00320789EB
DTYGEHSAFNGDFDPNSTLSSYNGMGSSSAHGMYFAQDAGGGQEGSGGETYYGKEAYDILQSYLNPQYTPNFDQFDFSKYGTDSSQFENVSDEEPVNFFGKDDKPVFHKKFKEMHDFFKNTKGDGIFRVYGHGNLNMLWNEDERLFSAKDFDKAMSAKNKNWANIDKYKSPILILFACLSASDVGNNGSIAKQISKAHPNLTVIGFRGFVEYDLSVKGIKNVNRQQGSGDENGLIVFYKNGQALSGYYYREFLKKYKNFK